MVESIKHSVVITASNMIKADKQTLYVPHLDNFYEQWLYENAERVTGISHFYTARFQDSELRGHLDAVEHCFDQLMRDSGLYRKINKKRSSRVGVIYFDQYGPVSFFNADAQIKEMYYSDVFPSFILNTHNISGYSVRLRAERCSLFQALELAQNLINGGELDMVIVGGVYQCIPYLFLTDVIDDYKWFKCNGMLKKKHSDLSLVDATGFLLLESSSHAEQRSADVMAELLSIECQLDPDKKTFVNQQVNSAFNYSFLRKQVESSSPDSFEKIVDMGCMTIFDKLHQSIKHENSTDSQLISGSDRDHYNWTLKLNRLLTSTNNKN